MFQQTIKCTFSSLMLAPKVDQRPTPHHVSRLRQNTKQTTCLWQQTRFSVTCFNSLTSAQSPHSFLPSALLSSPVKMSLACARGSRGGPHSLLQLSEPLVGKRQKERGRAGHKQRDSNWVNENEEWEWNWAKANASQTLIFAQWELSETSLPEKRLILTFNYISFASVLPFHSELSQDWQAPRKSGPTCNCGNRFAISCSAVKLFYLERSGSQPSVHGWAYRLIDWAILHSVTSELFMH